MNNLLNEILSNIRIANWENLDVKVYENFWEKITNTNLDDFINDLQKDWEKLFNH